MTRWKVGDGGRVVDLSDLKLPKGKKPPFAVGDLIRVSHVSTDGLSLVVTASRPATPGPNGDSKANRKPQHSGWFSASRFEKLQEPPCPI